MEISCYISLHLKDGLGIEFTLAKASWCYRRSASIIYRMWLISLLCRSDTDIEVTK